MIYLLEDDESIRKLVTYTLQHAGYEAAGLSCPSAFWAAMKRQTPELVLLDIMLPEEDGLSVLKKLRGSALWRELPVVMLTAKNAEYDRVVGLDAGADDYISKPFGMMELLARVRALLRRTGMTSAGEHTVGELYVCRDKHIVRVSGQDVPGDYFIALDNEFHKRLYTFSGYDRIWQAMHNVTTHMDRVRYLDSALCQVDMEAFREEHKQIYKYLMVGLPRDVDVEAFFDHHLGAYRENFQGLLEKFPDFFV